MNSMLWRLPGPSDFLDRVVGLLRDGSSVVVLLPDTAPDEFGERLLRHVGEHFMVPETVLAELGSPPVEEAFRLLLPGAPAEALHNVRTFVAQAEEMPFVASIGAFTPATWPGWRQFLEDFAHDALRVPQSRRSVFLALLQGAALGSPPEEDLALRVLPWWGVLGESDMLAYVSHRMPDREAPRALRSLLSATVVRLAMWDVELADILCGAAPEDILLPAALLRDYAQRRGWVGAEPSWENGGLGLFEGNEMVHSAWLGLRDPGDELAARLWEAQAGRLLPLVETQRRQLIPLVEPWLRLPFDTGFGTVSNPLDLEIGPIAYQLGHSGCPRQLYERAVLLREARNLLAHCHPLMPETVLSEVLYESPLRVPPRRPAVAS